MDALKSNANKLISLNLAKKIVGVLFITFLFNFFFFAAPALASESNNIDINNAGSYLDVINPADDALYIQTDNNSNGLILDEQQEIDLLDINYDGITKFLPKNDIKKPNPIKIAPITVKPTRIKMVLMTAYNSEAAQTDDSPCITATGFDVCKHGKEDTIAANFLKFGTKVKIPALFGDRVFIVRDRMNKRYTNKVDIWMVSRPKALQFGVKYAKIEIVP